MKCKLRVCVFGIEYSIYGILFANNKFKLHYVKETLVFRFEFIPFYIRQTIKIKLGFLGSLIYHYQHFFKVILTLWKRNC